MIENELIFTTPDRLPRDRFVFPEVLVGIFKDNDAIVEAIETEIRKRIQESTINNFTSEVVLKNVIGPFFIDLNNEEKKILLSIVDEIKDKKIEKEEKDISNKAVPKKTLSNNDLQEAIAGATNFLSEEAKRAGNVSEVKRTFKGSIIFDGDHAGHERDIAEIDDIED
ncbi:MAG: hypothetical protein WC682_00215 [Parcubacteria group bacterium]|jgi:hypothetical protein